MKRNHFLTHKKIQNPKCKTGIHKTPKRKHLLVTYLNIFPDMSPQAKVTKINIEYWDYIKLKTFVLQRKPSTKPKRQPIDRMRKETVYLTVLKTLSEHQILTTTDIKIKEINEILTNS